MALDPDLQGAIDALYGTFSHYKVTDFSPCAHGYPAKEVQAIEHALRTRPLRELTLNELSHFYQDGLLTWGTVDDFRALLPRLMELFAEYRLGETPAWAGKEIDLHIRIGPDFALLRFRHAGWLTWSTDERRAVDAYLLALWKSFLATGQDSPMEEGFWANEELPQGRSILRPLGRRSRRGFESQRPAHNWSAPC